MNPLTLSADYTNTAEAPLQSLRDSFPPGGSGEGSRCPLGGSSRVAGEGGTPRVPSTHARRLPTTNRLRPQTSTQPDRDRTYPLALHPPTTTPRLPLPPTTPHRPLHRRLRLPQPPTRHRTRRLPTPRTPPTRPTAETPTSTPPASRSSTSPTTTSYPTQTPSSNPSSTRWKTHRDSRAPLCLRHLPLGGSSRVEGGEGICLYETSPPSSPLPPGGKLPRSGRRGDAGEGGPPETPPLPAASPPRGGERGSVPRCPLGGSSRVAGEGGTPPQAARRSPPSVSTRHLPPEGGEGKGERDISPQRGERGRGKPAHERGGPRRGPPLDSAENRRCAD